MNNIQNYENEVLFPIVTKNWKEKTSFCFNIDTKLWKNKHFFCALFIFSVFYYFFLFVRILYHITYIKTLIDNNINLTYFNHKN